jgi:hypothetical protein
VDIFKSMDFCNLVGPQSLTTGAGPPALLALVIFKIAGIITMALGLFFLF